ncbi:MAG: DUF2730 family protein [Thermodesulfobacteriota bacterium]
MRELLQWWPVILFVTQALQGWFIWSLKQQFISRSDCKECKRDAAEQDKDATSRLGTLEADIHALPARPELHALGNKIEVLTEKIGHLDGRVAGINRAVDLMNQHLLRVNG